MSTMFVLPLDRLILCTNANTVHVIVIVLLVCNMMHMQQRAQGFKAPKDECCICIISHTRRTIPVISHVTMASLVLHFWCALGLLKQRALFGSISGCCQRGAPSNRVAFVCALAILSTVLVPMLRSVLDAVASGVKRWSPQKARRGA